MIDWERVEELRAEIGAEDFAEVVELFLEEVDEAIAKLRSAPDPTQFESQLHFLKGSALNLGFRELGDRCATGEQAAMMGNTESIDIKSVIQVYEVSIKEFTDRLSDSKAA